MRLARLLSTNWRSARKAAASFRDMAAAMFALLMGYLPPYAQAYPPPASSARPSFISPLVSPHWLMMIPISFLGIILLVVVFWSKRRHPDDHDSARLSVTRSRHERAKNIALFGTYELWLSVDSTIETTSWSDEMFHILRRARHKGAQTTEQFIAEYVFPDDRNNVRHLVLNTLHEKGSICIEYRVRCEDGKAKYVLDYLEFVCSKDGKHKFIGQLFDLTQRKLVVSENQHAHIGLEESNRALKKLIDHIEALREDEQRRLAREMHDDLGQLLAAMKIDLHTIQQYLHPDNAKARQRLDDMQNLVSTMVTSVRRIIANLPPKALEDLGLLEAIRFMVRDFEKRHGIACCLQLPDRETHVVQRVATFIYRVVQEALNNVAKHAHASQVELSLNIENECLRLHVGDNGVGLSPGAFSKAESCGLVGMRERVAALGGEMTLLSNAGEGTSINIEIPMTSPAMCIDKGT